MIIETNRLTIRSFLESDIPEYAAVVADPHVTGFLGDGSPHSYERAAAYIHNCIRSEIKEGIARYAVILRETGELIGFCGFKQEHDFIDFGGVTPGELGATVTLLKQRLQYSTMASTR